MILLSTILIGLALFTLQIVKQELSDALHTARHNADQITRGLNPMQKPVSVPPTKQRLNITAPLYRTIKRA